MNTRMCSKLKMIVTPRPDPPGKSLIGCYWEYGFICMFCRGNAYEVITFEGPRPDLERFICLFRFGLR